MRLTELSIRQPLVVVAITLAIGVFGLFAYFSLGIAITPNINFPSVVVTTIYPGADAESVESDVTRPIEDAIGTLPNIEANGLQSISSQGVSTVIVQFTTAVNPDLVSVDVERVVNGVRGKLPVEAESPTVTKVDINAFGVATVVFSGDRPLVQMQQYAEDVLQKQFNAVPGVGATNIRSGITREIQVLVDESRLRGRGLSINQVWSALQEQQLEIPAGTITQGGRDYSVYFDALVTDPRQLGSIVLVQTPSGAVYLRDVARIDDTVKKRSAIVRVNGQEGLALVVVKLPDSNTLAVVDGLKRTIERLNPDLPLGTRLDVVVDSSTYTWKSFSTVQRALLEAILFTGLILLLFLHTIRSTMIVLVSIPTSLLVTLVMMSVLGYNLNLLTMMALTLSVGILVDDSIVVLENIFRHLNKGKPPFLAALDGRSEIGLAAITITLVDVVVYVPIALMLSGVSAQFLRPFALTIAIATLASLVVSFTLTPLLAATMLRADQKAAWGLWQRLSERWDSGFILLERRYRALLRWSMSRRWRVIGLGFASFGLGLSLWFLGLIGSDFFPSGDQSEIDITLSMPSGTSLEATDAVAQDVERRLIQLHEVRTVYSIVGQTTGGIGGNDTGVNQAMITALLVQPHDRQQSSAALGAELRERFVALYPGARIQIGLPNAFGFGGFGGQPIQVQVQGIDPARLDVIAAQVEQAVRQIPGAASVRSSNENRQTQVRVQVDWNRASDLGVSPQSAGLALRMAIDGFKSSATQFRQTGLSAVDIRVVSASGSRATLQDIASLPVSTHGGGVVRLDQIATLRQAEIPTSIRRVNRLRAVTIGAEPGEGQLVGDVQSAIVRAVSQVTLPPGYGVTYTGQGQQGRNAFGEIFRALGVAILLMYMLMMVLFGSVTLPLAVLMSLPLALVGAFGAMALTKTPFTLFSLLGYAVLIGLVGKNAILLVDYTEILRQRGYSRRAALLEAGPTRLRPIVMTTLSVMVALIPIASGLEEGSELLKSAAVVLIGGLFTSTLLTLVFVPAMYTLFDDLQRAVARWTWRGQAEPEDDDAPPWPPAESLEPAHQVNGREAQRRPLTTTSGER